jgi:hypothetical protein
VWANAKTVPFAEDLAGVVASPCAHALKGHTAAGNHVRICIRDSTDATASTIYREN